MKKFFKFTIVLVLLTAFSLNTNAKQGNQSLLGISEAEGDLTLFGIKWNDMYDQNVYSAEVLKNPLQNLTIGTKPDLKDLYNNYEDLIKLIERNLAFRAKAVNFLEEVRKQRKLKKAEVAKCIKDNPSNKKECKDDKTTLSPDQTTRLTNGAKEFLLLRYLNTYATKLYEAKADAIFKNEVDRKKKIKLSETQVVEILMGFSAALTLYDNYVLMVSQFERDLEISRIFKNGVETLGLPYNSIETISRNSRKFKYRLKLGKVVKWMQDENFQIKANEYNELDKAYNYLLTYVNSTVAYKVFNTNIIKLSLGNLYKRITRGLVVKFIQDIIGIERSVANELSEAFGNTVGLIEARKGYMYIGKNGKFHKSISSSELDKVSKQQRKDYHLKMRESLEPGDVLLEKTPFRLTDKFIPGHWGHVAIWTGSITDLKERGLWDLIISSQDWIRLNDKQKEYIMQSLKDNPSDPVKDRAILEALRPGVQLNDLYHFLNVDDVAILKPKLQSKTPEQRKVELAEIIAMSFTHVLKDYDFNFDVRDTNKIVCSELAWHTYTNCHFKTQTILSRASINPDDVADAVFGDLNDRECFSVDYIVHDGTEVDPKQYNLRETLRSLNKNSTLQ